MTLRDETWTRCSLDEVVDQFMRAAEPEIRDKFVAFLRDTHLGELRVITAWEEAEQAHGRLEAVVALRQQKSQAATPDAWNARTVGAHLIMEP